MFVYATPALPYLCEKERGAEKANSICTSAFVVCQQSREEEEDEPTYILL